jgi:hypothetical protein
VIVFGVSGCCLFGSARRHDAVLESGISKTFRDGREMAFDGGRVACADTGGEYL